MSDLYHKLHGVELNDVKLWEALSFVNNHCKGDKEKMRVLMMMQHRCNRGTMTLAEFERLLSRKRKQI